MSIATLLSQHHQVTAVDIIPEKVDMINNRNDTGTGDYQFCDECYFVYSISGCFNS